MLRDTINLLNEVGNPLFKQSLQDVVKNLVKNNNNYNLNLEDLN
jgi:chaperonin cofactor prefoldin